MTTRRAKEAMGTAATGVSSSANHEDAIITSNYVSTATMGNYGLSSSHTNCRRTKCESLQSRRTQL